MSTANNMNIDLFREQILAAAKNKTPYPLKVAAPNPGMETLILLPS